MDNKNLIIENLKKLSNVSKLQNQVFKQKAFDKAIVSIQKINSIHSLKDLDGIPGVGKGIKEKIKELFENGTISELSEYELQLGIIESLMTVYGIGPSKAQELYNVHNIRSINDLKEHTHLLNQKQQIGLKYHSDLLLRIPREEMDEHYKHLHTFFKHLNNSIEYNITGSYRRECQTSGDIDVLVTHNNLNIFRDIINELIKSSYIVETLAKGEKKFMGICKIDKRYRRIDILYVNKENFPFALLYFTGSGDFNIDMRNHALKLGYSLNEYQLTHIKTKESIILKTEKDIFTFLKLKYIPPNARESNILSNYLL